MRINNDYPTTIETYKCYGMMHQSVSAAWLSSIVVESVQQRGMAIHGVVAILCAAGLVVGVGSVFSASKRGVAEWVVRGTCYVPGKPYPALLSVGFFLHP